MEQLVRQTAAVTEVHQCDALSTTRIICQIGNEAVIAADTRSPVQIPRCQGCKAGCSHIKGEAVRVFKLEVIHTGNRAGIKHEGSVVRIPKASSADRRIGTDVNSRIGHTKGCRRFKFRRSGQVNFAGVRQVVTAAVVIPIDGCVMNADHRSEPGQCVARPVGRVRPEAVTGFAVPVHIIGRGVHIKDDPVIRIIPNQAGSIAAVVGDNQVEVLEFGVGQGSAVGKVDQCDVLGRTGKIGHIHLNGLTGKSVNHPSPGLQRLEAIGIEIESEGNV